MFAERRRFSADGQGGKDETTVRIHTSLSFFWAISLLSLNTRYRAAQVMRVPWPKSPNMTANRKGKVIMVYGAEDRKAGIKGR